MGDPCWQAPLFPTAASPRIKRAMGTAITSQLAPSTSARAGDTYIHAGASSCPRSSEIHVTEQSKPHFIIIICLELDVSELNLTRKNVLNI